MFNDSNRKVRLNSVQGLIYYAQSRYGIDSLLKNNILELVIRKIKEEKEEDVTDHLLTLSSELLNAQGAPQIALKNELISILKAYVDHKNLKILENVINNFGSLSLCEEGKKACVEGIIPFIKASLIEKIIAHIQKLTDIGILIASTRFLKSVSILKAGKVQIFEMNGIDYCLVSE
jgi:transcriptional regulator of aromatic amino acid metabolism